MIIRLFPVSTLKLIQKTDYYILMKSINLTLLLNASLLLIVIGLVAYGSTKIPEPTFEGKLKDLLPLAPSGWAMKEKPIAESAEMQQAVGELLNFDDGIFADYTNSAGDRLSVYLAYWTPGKMSHRLVAGHTPDVCWEGGGWVRTHKAQTPALHLVGILRARDIPVGEDRIFTAQSTPEYVWFWHLVGDQVKSYGTGYAPKWYSPITDLFDQGLNQRKEQFFIRLSSNRPLASLLDGEVLPKLLIDLPWPEQQNDI
jgi:Protein of unknown function (DUF3485)